MYQRAESFFNGHGQVQLFFQAWEKQNPEGHIVITHGHGEHSDCYQRVIEALKEKNWSIWAWDMRGHGRSEGKRGYASHFEDYILDYQIFLKLLFTQEKFKNKNVVLLAHSMGGLVQLQTLIEKPELQIQAQICSAPMLGVAVHVPAWKKLAAQVALSLAPQITLGNEITNDQITRDLEIIKEFETDALRHDRISPGVYLGFEPSFKTVHENAQSITTPTLFLLPEEDPVVSTQSSLSFFEKISSTNKVLKTYGNGAKHEMFNDTHRLEVYHDLIQFLDSVKGFKK
jgi:alpha-beta hydrolase superfamily lysophospholipase